MVQALIFGPGVPSGTVIEGPLTSLGQFQLVVWSFIIHTFRSMVKEMTQS